MALLETHKLTARYGDFQAVFGVDITLHDGETIALVGANGAGKTSLMRSISGLLAGKADTVLLEGEPIGHLPADEVMQRGVAMVPEGRRLFASLTVEENLLVGTYGRNIPGYWSLATVYDLFPALKERRHNPGTALSGGQQQMVAIARALMSNPRVLLCDEISLGLAPVIIGEIYAALPQIKAAGASLLIVEQDTSRALKVADRIYCMMEGRVTLEGRPQDLGPAAIHDAYFGTAPRGDDTP